ncbi:MAG: hypothetical protein JXB30_16890 [Anaerolineae bacterium]|nr:hypothetical protein [Anaerolineae bacterium]
MTTMAKVAMIVMLISGTATGTAFAADASLPGQPLYPLDLQMEQVQTRLATTTEAQTKLGLGLANERANEVHAMVQAGQTPDQATMAQFQSQFGQTLQLVAQLQEPEMVQALEQLRNMAQEQAQQMQDADFEQGEAVMNQVREQAQKGIDDPEAFRRQYRGGATEDRPAGPPDDTPGAENGNRDQSRDQQKDGDEAQQGPKATPGAGNGNGGGNGSGNGNGGSGEQGGGNQP